MRRNLSLSISCITFLALFTPALCFADFDYTVSVNTSSVSLINGYIDMQFNPSSLATQMASANVSSFSTDGALNASAPYSGTTGDVSGRLPGNVTFDNGQSTNEYTEGIKFGTAVTFDLSLYGPALDSPNGDGGGSFFLSFFDEGGNPLLTDSPLGDVLEIDINGDGSTTITTPTYNGGNPVASVSAVPEPSSLLLLAGILPLLALCRRKRAVR